MTLDILSPEQFAACRRTVFATQTAAARAMGVAISTVNRWERSARPIPRWAAELILAWKRTGGPAR